METVKANWQSPLQLATYIEQQAIDMILLHSGQSYPHTGRYSLLAFDKKQEIITDDIANLAPHMLQDQPIYHHSWFGYIGYEAKNTIESLPVDSDSPLTPPTIWMMQFHHILVFDHQQQHINIHSSKPDLCQRYLQQSLHVIPEAKALSIDGLLQSNMSKEEYLSKILFLKEKIANGDLYQANLTRKFYGSLRNYQTLMPTFSLLHQISPACYSAFLKMGKYRILSSSPEQFISIDANGNMSSRPIKGSAPRHSDPDKDHENRIALEQSTKDKAENLMIVDLMRHDFSKAAKIGSVAVENLYNVVSYPTIHHMDSTIHGKKLATVSTVDAIRHCFPPGSMTGTPKIKAMEYCSLLEQQKRGIYSGAIGWFGGDASCDLSVVIRTLIIKDHRFEFQVGGAITYDSNAEQEWEETLTKAKAMIALLKIDEATIRKL